MPSLHRASTDSLILQSLNMTKGSKINFRKKSVGDWRGSTVWIEMQLVVCPV